jgi:hypothetical protein
MIQLGQQEQVVDQRGHPRRLVTDVTQGHGHIGRPVLHPELEELRVAEDGGEGGAQFVGGVSQEATQPVLGRRPLGEGDLDLVEHGVEGQSQLADLGALGHRLDPLGEVAVGDGTGGLGHRLERAQVTAHHHPREHPQSHEDRSRDDELDAEEAAQGRLQIGEGQRHHDHTAPVSQRLGQGPVGHRARPRARGGEIEVPACGQAAPGQLGRDRRGAGGLAAVGEEEVRLDRALRAAQLTVGTRRDEHTSRHPPPG